MNAKVDFFFQKPGPWQEEFRLLRTLVQGFGLTEELKWGHPCYTFEEKNVLVIHGFKEYCGLLFFKGALLKDPKGILIQQTANVQGSRQARFTSAKEITKNTAALKACIREAIAAEKAGLKVPMKKTADFPVPEEFRSRLKEQAPLKKAFDALTPGRQRNYLLHFAAPKQAKTRESRIDKAIPKILQGKGLND